MTRVCVTGAAGFIGGHLCERLLKEGVYVVGVDLVNDYYDTRFKKETLSILKKYPNFRFYKGDIRDKGQVRLIWDTECADGPFDCVVHLAAQAGVRYSVQNPTDVGVTNVDGTNIILEVSHEYKIPNLVCASSSSVYGANSVAPFSEDQTCDKPISPYAASKRANELFAFTHWHLYKTPITMLRFFTVFGPRGRPDMAAFKFIKKIDGGDPIDKYGDGSAIREFTYIDDIVEGVVRSMKTPNGFRIVNLGGGSTYTLNQFIEMIESRVGKKAIINQLPMQPGDVMITSADQKYAKEALGFQPQTSLEEGIRKTWEWYSQCDYAKQIPI